MSPNVPADLEPGRLFAELATERIGRSLEVLASVDSTMDAARAAADAGAPHGHCIVADRQTRGRGAHGRAWESPPGTDLYLSCVVRAPLPPERRPLATLATGLAVAEAAERLGGTRAMVKWPNDVWLEERKCAGVLVETSTGGSAPGALIVGIGLDVNRREWPEALREHAVSLAEVRRDGRDLDRAVVLADLLGAVERWLERLWQVGPAPIVDALGERLALKGEWVVGDGVTGVLEGVGPLGAALIRDGTHLREVVAGTLRRG